MGLQYIYIEGPQKIFIEMRKKRNKDHNTKQNSKALTYYVVKYRKNNPKTIVHDQFILDHLLKR